MANYVVFWGHGRWLPTENPAKAIVPTGCRLLLFARHKEQINVERMISIISDLRECGLDDEEEFTRRIKTYAHLRTIKTAGEAVHNYRLFPYDDGMGSLSSVTGLFDAVTTTDEAGVPLSTLAEQHGKPGATLLWLPCRHVEGLAADQVLFDDAAGVDGAPVYDEDRKTVVARTYVRPTDYFKQR